VDDDGERELRSSGSRRVISHAAVRMRRGGRAVDPIDPPKRARSRRINATGLKKRDLSDRSDAKWLSRSEVAARGISTADAERRAGVVLVAPATRGTKRTSIPASTEPRPAAPSSAICR